MLDSNIWRMTATMLKIRKCQWIGRPGKVRVLSSSSLSITLRSARERLKYQSKDQTCMMFHPRRTRTSSLAYSLSRVLSESL